MTMWTPLSLLTACASVESTKRSIWTTTDMPLLRTLQEHGSSLSRILPEKKQRFMNQLFKKYSTMAQEKVFSDTFSTTALAVYESFESAETLANMDLHQLTEFIIEKGKNRFPDPDSVAKAIQKGRPELLPSPQDGKRLRQSGAFHIHKLYESYGITDQSL